MTETIEDLKEKLRIAEEEKIISEGGFRCIRCGRVLESKFKFSEDEVRSLWIVDPKQHPDPSLKEMCFLCAKKQFEGITDKLFREIMAAPQDIEVIQIRLSQDKSHHNYVYPAHDRGYLGGLILKFGEFYFELERGGIYDEDQATCPYIAFIGREGDENVKERLYGN